MDLGDFNPVFQVLSLAVLTILLYSVLVKVKRVNNASLSSEGRYLGVYEDLFNLWYETRDRGGILCLVLSLKSKKKLLKQHVEKALIFLTRRQPMLRAVVVKSAKNKQCTYFKIISEDEISEMIDLSVSSESNWANVWNELSEKPFAKLSWRAVLMKDEYFAKDESYKDTLVFAFNHAFVDGVSGIKFAKQFLENLNNIAMKSDAYKPSLPLESNVTQLLKNGRQSLLKFFCDFCGLSFISKLLFKRKLRKFLSAKQRNPFFAEFPSNLTALSRRTTKILHKVYSYAETSKIINACKRNKCTVTGAIMASAHMGLCKVLDTGPNKGDVKFEHTFAINAKRFCKPPPPEDYLGHFALSCQVILDHVNEEQEFWQLAQKLTAQIHSSLKDEEFIHQHIKTCRSFNSKEQLNEILSPSDLGELNRISFCCGNSSAGSFNFNEGATDLVHELDYCMYWNLVHRVIGVFFSYNVTVNGKMSWVLAYDSSRVSDEHTERISKWCFESLLKLSQDN